MHRFLTSLCATTVAVALSSSTFAVSALAAQPAPGAAGADPAAGMTDEQKMERAKQLFGEGNAAVEAGDYATAVQKFEEAYLVYAPQLHVFNFNIGSAAFYANDCVKAKAALQRFLDLVPEHPERATAQEMLLEIERTKCAEEQAAAQPAPQPDPQPQVAVPVEQDNEDAPILESKRDERERAIEAERAETDRNKASGLLIGGAVLAALGGAALIGGGVSAGLAFQKTKRLASESEPSPYTGFPTGDYSSDEIFNLDRTQLKNNNIATIALFVGGGALFATGIVLIGVDIAKKKKAKKSGSSDEARRLRPHLVGAGPTWLPGGGGAAATVRF